MIDLTKIDDNTLMARGSYSTVRAELEDEKKRMQVLAGEMLSTTTQILRRMQPEGDAVPDGCAPLFVAGRATLDAMELATLRIVSLAQQKHDLRVQAWGKKP